ncbi:hypothetical protein AMAG_19828 [Allomyces macrogynus ATCC 38327]|uniref:Uncharacterized protein n=1 Tax=Allomyces macrogynus (strain ATCC 38327) TaxID=578462 RepID=A0A0L0SZT7_ALLM3|nr:hypothetical protein AMAG_19828 [Allomyces macrogynus ATCC 38327]|eukprot:KNE67996.1 hypothetical protein AMAG_19828 [Allomyces macrogynus ATCC 38327]
MDQVAGQAVSHNPPKMSVQPNVTATTTPAMGPVTIGNLPTDVQHLIVYQILASSCGDVPNGFVQVHSPTASTILALRRVNREWQAAVDVVLPGWHAVHDLFVEIPLQQPTTNRTNRKGPHVWHKTVLAPLPRFESNRIHSLSLTATQRSLINIYRPDRRRPFADVERVLNMDLSRITAWSPTIAQVILNSPILWHAAAVVPALFAWSTTLTSLSLTVTPDWNQAAAGLELPFLRQLDITINRASWRRHPNLHLETLPLAQWLQSLQVNLEGVVRPEAIAQYARTLRSLIVMAIPTAESEPTKLPWRTLKCYRGSPQAFFHLMAGHLEMASLTCLELRSPTKYAPPMQVIDGKPQISLPNLTVLSADVAVVSHLSYCLVLPQLARAEINLGTPTWREAVPDLPWPSITNLILSQQLSIRHSDYPVLICGAMLDALTKLVTLTLPQTDVVWVNNISPKLSSVTHLKASAKTLSRFADYALPALERVTTTDKVPLPLCSLPAACMQTLWQVDAPVLHLYLATFLAHMPSLERLTVKGIEPFLDVLPLSEWRLTYVQGNPVWSAVPAIEFSFWLVDKLIIEVGAVADAKRMAVEIENMARWCAKGVRLDWETDWPGARTENKLVLDVHVLPAAADVVWQHIEKMVQVLLADGIDARVLGAVTSALDSAAGALSHVVS